MSVDRVLNIATAARRDSKRWKQDTIMWEEIVGWTETPASRKDCGNYLLGLLDGPFRRKETVVSRSAVTLDADYSPVGLPDQVQALPWASIVHSTFQSAPDKPRYRVIFPLDRDVTPEEYFAVCQVLLERLGRKQFDPSTVEPERFMFKPSTEHPEWYQCWVTEGEMLPVEELLAEFDSDLSKLPTPRLSPNKRNPYELEGVAGAFNRVYTFDEVIEAYEIPYESAGESRWHLVGAHSEAGISIISDGLIYSHHVKDPAWGVACSAFDLVRLHRFSELDEGTPETTPVNRRPSHEAMLELAAGDKRVFAEMIGLDFSEEVADGEWKLKLNLNTRTGKFIDTIENWDLVRQHDPAFRGLYFNEMTLSVETSTELPWRPLERGGEVFSSIDRSALCLYLEREYKIRPARSFVDELVNVTAQQTYVHPVRNYLDALKWDGKQRVEKCLPGVRPTPYTRMVARKSLVAAVARVYEPGVKWDHTLILFGPEGLGKTWWVEKITRGLSATLGRIGDKDTLLTMQRSWVLLSDEGHSLRKADTDTQKEFLTRTQDVFRMPYDREAAAHPRQCVIWGSTNDEVFLRRQEGNRRFLIVKCEDKVDFDKLTPRYVDQLWAEAVHLYRAGERLFLDDDESVTAAEEREKFTEEDALGGVVGAYLDMLVPEDWDDLSPDARVSWMMNRADGLEAEGTVQQRQVCSAQIWVEALGRRFGDHKRADLLDISAALRRQPGWVALEGRHRLPNYGVQVVYERIDDLI